MAVAIVGFSKAKPRSLVFSSQTRSGRRTLARRRRRDSDGRRTAEIHDTRRTQHPGQSVPLLGALADYTASEAALRFELARQYPNVHLAPGYQWDQAENKWSLGLKFELPAVSRNQGPIAEAEARRKLAEAQFFRLQASVLAEIDRATIAYRATRERFADLEALLRMQREQRDAIEIRSKAGAVSLVDLLDAQLQVATAELLRFEAALKLQQALGTLEDAMQQPA